MNKALEKINKAKVKILQKSPFFSYLSLYLKIEECKDKSMDSIGVSPKGKVLYNSDFIESITDEELLGVMAHEILHLALLHLTRVGNRHKQGWNIATDLCINSMLQNENFQLPKFGLIPSYNRYKILGVEIENIDSKIAEQIYDELPIKEMKEGKGKGESDSGNGNGTSEGLEGFDKHEYEDEGTPMNESEKAEFENEWLNRVNEAYIHAKERGHAPKGMERYIDSLKKARINWKGLMNRYLVAQIPHDYTWKRRGKKSYATGLYLPDSVKEMIDVVVAIDTSGSIGQEELTEFISEIVGLAKAYKSQINIRIMTHDIEVHEDLMIENGNIAKIKELKCKGGGGTEHTKVFDYIKGKYKDTKCVISFTDGWSDLDDINFKDYNFNKIFVINKNGTDRQLQDKKCVKINMKDY